MRSKEEANDYRYFPEPDLPPLVTPKETIAKIKLEIPELPREKKFRFIKDYKITVQDAETLSEDKDLSDYFEACLKTTIAGPKKTSNWIQSELLGILNERKLDIKSFSKEKVPPKNLSALLDFIEDGTISGKTAKDVFMEMSENGGLAKDIIDKKGFKQISSTGELESVVDKVILANPGEVEKYKAGNTKLLGFFVGETMKLTRGQANPKTVNEIIKNKLG